MKRLKNKALNLLSNISVIGGVTPDRQNLLKECAFILFKKEVISIFMFHFDHLLVLY
ncbi:hypothetical protein B4144_2993 [Bacillus atrophaeus]|nr:hypothetical protein B4144_2993 [Bacillus atrophaeus]